MVKTENVQFIVDEKGRKKSVIMSYKTYQQILEDLSDLRKKAERRDEQPEDLANIVADLKNAGRL